MNLSAQAPWLFIPIQIFFVDLLLGADNAMVIALVCRSLHPDDRRAATLIGTGGAVVFRFLATVAASFVLTVPGLKLAGALALIFIAVNLTGQEKPGALGVGAAPRTPSAARASLWSAALIVVAVDATMSIDNVVALAAIARGNIWLLALGVLFSIPVLVSGSLLLANLLQNNPALVVAGCGLLGWIAGDMAIGDPAIADWANSHAPALVLIAPALGAAYVVIQARFVAEDRRKSFDTPRKAAGQITVRLLSDRRPALPAATRQAPKTTAEADLPRADVNAAPRSLEARAGRGRKAREDRMVLVGLILLAALAGGMVAFVMWAAIER